MDADGQEIVRVSRYFGPGLTNNKTDSYALREALVCLESLRRKRPDLDLPARIFEDSQLLIRFLMGIFGKPQKPTIYQALNLARMKAARLLHVAYHYITRSANQVADNMARWALEAKDSVIYWGGQVPDGAPANQVDEVYHQQEDVPHLKPNLPKLLDWTVVPTIAACFGAEWGQWVMLVRAAVH